MNYNNHGLPYQPVDTGDKIPEPPTSGSSINSESEDIMPTTWYHFIFSNDASYDIRSAISLKDAVWEMAKYHGDASEMFRKCLNGYDEDDVDGIVELYNHFSYTDIGEIYVIEKAIYSNKE